MNEYLPQFLSSFRNWFPSLVALVFIQSRPHIFFRSRILLLRTVTDRTSARSRQIHMVSRNWRQIMVAFYFLLRKITMNSELEVDEIRPFPVFQSDSIQSKRYPPSRWFIPQFERRISISQWHQLTASAPTFIIATARPWIVWWTICICFKLTLSVDRERW